MIGAYFKNLRHSLRIRDLFSKDGYFNIDPKTNFTTKSELIFEKALKIFPDLNIKLVDEESPFNISSEIAHQMKNKKINSKAYVFSNSIDEAKGILDFFNKNKELNIAFATNNRILNETVRAISGSRSDNEIESKKRRWLASANCLFRIYNDFYINFCGAHSLRINETKKEKIEFVKENLKNIREQFEIQVDQISFDVAFKAHSAFIKSIYGEEIDQLFKDFGLNLQIENGYQYIREFELFCKSKLKSRKENKIQTFKIEELPWVDGLDAVWIGGANQESLNNYVHLEFLEPKTKLIVSFSKFEQGISREIHYMFNSSKIIDNTVSYPKRKILYKNPCPAPEFRDNSFAINHIVKLINNPLVFYIESILRIKQTKFHNNHIFGIIIHNIFETYVKDNPETIEFDKMYRIINSILDKYNLYKRDKLMIQKKIYLMCEALFDILVNASELYPEQEGVQEITQNDRTFMLHGRADLVYKTKGGMYGVIDFKTGVSPSWINIVSGIAPQISLEMLILKFGGFLGEQCAELAPSGFVSPKGFFQVSSSDMIIESSIKGLSKLIKIFWEEESEYYYSKKDENATYQLIIRNYHD